MEDDRDISDTARIVGSVADMLAAVDNILPPLREAHRAIIEPLERNRELLVGIQRRFEQLTAFADAIDREKRLGEAGWIPHPLLPLDEVTADLLDDPDELDEFLLEHLRAHWGAVEAQLLDDDLFRIIGEEHQETVRQALAAHDAGLYRCVPRTMFGEIEMAAHAAREGIDLSGKVTAQLRPVWCRLKELTIADLHTGGRSAVSYFLAKDSVYADTRDGGADSRLPNRHDQIHGFSRRHASERDSVNTLLLADMMFRLLAALRAEPDE
jgi:hypothetical protein